MKRFIGLFLLFVILPIYAKIVLDDSMSSEQMEKTGVNQLNYSQKMALQEWINDNFDNKEGRPKKDNEQLFLSLNFAEGEKLELSDGSTYEIDPDDRIYSKYWITPFPIMLGESDNPEYPVKIMNMNTGTSVNGREISTKEFLEEEAIIEKEQQPAPKPTEKPTQQQPLPKPTEKPQQQQKETPEKQQQIQPPKTQ
jgi:hypothetical protein